MVFSKPTGNALRALAVLPGEDPWVRACDIRPRPRGRRAPRPGHHRGSPARRRFARILPVETVA